MNVIHAPEVLLEILELHTQSDVGAWCDKCGHHWPCTDKQAASLIRTLTERLIKAGVTP
jgi:hypothetical protein